MSVRVISAAFRLAAAALIALAIVQGAPPAWADAAAGNAAFERGDYVRAMAEWASAAERGDRDAEFGLGMLYERGVGELKQDYKQADRWYRKAAEHGNFGAVYRLALISSAGSEDFPADLVEAYKWITLAAEKGVATDVKTQLGEVLDRNQKAEAEKRVATWKQALAKKAEEAAAAVAPAPVAAPAAPAPVAAPAKPAAPAAPASGGAASASGGAGIPPPRSAGAVQSGATKSGGCPGWPFPTLPCTEQFPALPGAAAPAQRPAAPK